MEMKYASVNGTDLAYNVQGEGPPLLLIHGTGVPASTWSPRFLERMGRGRTVITFDYRGTGSTPPSEEELSTRLIAKDATDLLTHLDMYPADVLGHSMGGRVAQWVALDEPQMVRSLVLDSSGPGEFGGVFPVTRGIPLGVALEVAELGMVGHFEHEAREVGFSPKHLEENGEGFRELVESFKANPTPIREYLRLTIARQQHQTAGLLRDIRVPTLVLVGDLEATTGGTGSHIDQARYMANMIPQAEFVMLEGLNHFHFWEEPQATGDIVMEWLERVPRNA